MSSSAFLLVRTAEARRVCSLLLLLGGCGTAAPRPKGEPVEAGDRSSDTAPDSAQDSETDADTDTDSDTAPPVDVWSYPENGTHFPYNSPEIILTFGPRHAWTATITGDAGSTTVANVVGSLALDPTLREQVLGSDGGMLEVVLEREADGEDYQSTALSLSFEGVVTGDLRYFSTTAQGILKLPFGGVVEEEVTRGTVGQCTGCHAVSSGGLLALNWRDAGADSTRYSYGPGGLGILNIATSTWIRPDNQDGRSNFKAFSPDGSQLMTTWDGCLVRWDVSTGTELSETCLDEPITHIDWSPDGTQLVAVATTGLWDLDAAGGRIVTIPVLSDHSFGPIETLYDPPDPAIAYYPAFSPDGAWVAFNIAADPRTDGWAGYSEPEATLALISASGGSPILLDQANDVGDLTNSWPRWAPDTTDGSLWLAFSSLRAAPGVDPGFHQLWVTAIDPILATAGTDPSTPAFWLPGQRVDESNHSPTWSP